jgi:hypothetical protein
MNQDDKERWFNFCLAQLEQREKNLRYWNTQDKQPLLQWLSKRELPSYDTVCNVGCIFDYEEHGYYQDLASTFDNIIYVDISIDDLEMNLSGNNIRCYKTEGLELSGIASDSVDFIMSTDSLVRLKIDDALKYFKEFRRVLKSTGAFAIHLALNMEDSETLINEISSWSTVLPFPEADYVAGVKK